MQAPFDILADMDTPVSVYLKLADLAPRYLLESVEQGQRLARYSFLGFGHALDVRLDAEGFMVDGKAQSVPTDQAEFLAALRGALANAPRPQPEIPRACRSPVVWLVFPATTLSVALNIYRMARHARSRYRRPPIWPPNRYWCSTT